MSQPNFGPNVYIFNPTMPLSQIQATVNMVASQQVSNQFGTQRYALLFEPGTYGSSTNPLNFQVGYYTTVAGLGLSPGDVVINGSIDVYNQCLGTNNCIALVNFWRSLSNLTINVTTPNAGCHTGEFWAVSQAAPMRRVHVIGSSSLPITLMDYCTSPSYASGGFIADSEFDGTKVINGSQQQWLIRNSQITGWSNGVWNQVFSGVVGAPAQCFPAASSCGGPYTTLATSPVTREAPYLYVDSNGHYNVFVPSVQHNSSGTTWANGATPGSSIPISKFFIAQPSDSVATINKALGSGTNLILTPGIYNLNQSIVVSRPDTVILGLGFPTLIPQNGVLSMSVASAKGMMISGLIFDAGATNSLALLLVGNGHGGSDHDASDPSGLYDVFFQNEMPYDPPSQAAWMEAPGVDGWAAFKVKNNVSSFSGYGMGSYSFFNQGVNIYAARAFEVPATLPAGSLHDLLTIFLSTAGFGGILHVVNNTGGSSTSANPDTPVTVVSYP